MSRRQARGVADVAYRPQNHWAAARQVSQGIDDLPRLPTIRLLHTRQVALSEQGVGGREGRDRPDGELHGRRAAGTLLGDQALQLLLEIAATGHPEALSPEVAENIRARVGRQQPP